MTLPLMAKDHAQWGLLVVFVHHVALPLGALAEHNQRVIARICALLLDEHLDEFVEIDLVFGDDTADRGDVRGVERCKTGIAAEDAENADSARASRRWSAGAGYARGFFPISSCIYILCVNAIGRISALVAASINTAMKGVVSEQTRRKGDDCDEEFKGSPEEASRCTLQAGRARVRWSKGDDRI